MSGVRFGEYGSSRWSGRFGGRLVVTAVGVIAATFLLSLAASAQTEPLQITAVSAEGWPAVEEVARKAPVKMVMPLVLFVMPTFFIITVGPIAVHLLEFVNGKAVPWPR